MERMLTVDQVAQRLKVNEQTVRRWLREGALVGVPFGGRTGWRVKVDDLQAFLDRRRFVEGAQESAQRGKSRGGSGPH